MNLRLLRADDHFQLTSGSAGRLFTNEWRNSALPKSAQIQISSKTGIIEHMQTSRTSFRIVMLILPATLITACSKETRRARFLAEADNYFKAGSYDKAKLSYLNVLRLDPANALALERIG